MKIKFVSHASFITKVNGKNIICDPWVKGKVFNDGWALLSPAYRIDWSSIDYIYISHEHPDHFNFPTLKSIPTEDKSRIKILYQKHASLRLKNAFLKLGFKEVIELSIYKWSTIDDIDFYCGSAGSMDAFLAIRHNNQTCLNLNDCVFNNKQYNYIKRKIGKIDILFTQFSFANWVGNDKDEYDECGQKIEDIRKQIEIFKPTSTIPFASFVYFCSKENSRMNDWVNTPKKIADLNLNGVNFMYPGDEIEVQNPIFKSSEAVNLFMADFQNIEIDKTPETISLQDILNTAQSNLATFHKKINPLFRKFVKPFSIFIHDLDKTILIDPKNNKISLTQKSKAKYEMCSQVCWYMFKWGWGANTLQVSGMYKDLKMDQPTSKYFFFQNMISTEYLLLKSFKQVIRTSHFFYRKKWELFYKFF
ncbi:MBL fold metallo-hydrolase [Pseudotenacibaculum sp. MALMAid0570]|uniref:MBL fold metallo-hydrolase n=1 Tax=Pseudotenacibaculum sp. MALMAid0570 TaxID=3143938 RepID=UPI0032E00C53